MKKITNLVKNKMNVALVILMGSLSAQTYSATVVSNSENDIKVNNIIYHSTNIVKDKKTDPVFAQQVRHEKKNSVVLKEKELKKKVSQEIKEKHWLKRSIDNNIIVGLSLKEHMLKKGKIEDGLDTYKFANEILSPYFEKEIIEKYKNKNTDEKSLEMLKKAQSNVVFHKTKLKVSQSKINEKDYIVVENQIRAKHCESFANHFFFTKVFIEDVLTTSMEEVKNNCDKSKDKRTVNIKIAYQNQDLRK